ncbi:polyamine transporter tpo5 [Microbotryomycetes sp. JL201]|nr:polyamine transporter tpo5 [Microbotryomycetes sp. JL201]
MSTQSEKSSIERTSSRPSEQKAADDTRVRLDTLDTVSVDDEAELARLGYKSEFAREFKSLSTISFAFSIMGVASSAATTFNTPFLLGGPASVVWCWFLGTLMCFCLGTAIAEIVSAYPTNGGLYSASAYLVPLKYRPIVGWVVGYLNCLGQVAGVASTEYGLAQMILTAASLSTGGTFVATPAQTYGLFAGLLCIHGMLNSLATKWLAKMTQFFVFINLGTVIAIIIALLITTDNKHPASYVFTHKINGSGWSSEGLVFLLGLLSVQWTMTDYDATAHISEEVRRASYAAPVAIFIAVLGTGAFGWVYNIVYVLCSGDMADYDGSIYAPAQIIFTNVGAKGFYVLWTGVCLTAFLVVQTALQANARTFFAFSRDRGLPDRGLFARLASNRIPIWSVWLVVFISLLMGLLAFASYVAVGAIFALCAMALDTSYIIPIACKLIFRDHPEVQYRPGPFDLGRGLLGWAVPLIAIFWTSFVVIILALPTIVPVTKDNMNYASVVTGGVMIISLVWYYAGGRRHYKGPRNVLAEEHDAQIAASGAEFAGPGKPIH